MYYKSLYHRYLKTSFVYYILRPKRKNVTNRHKNFIPAILKQKRSLDKRPFYI